MDSNEKKPQGFQKGQVSNPKGRPVGPNKINKEVRERFKEIVEGQLDNVTEALDRIALEDPSKYIDILTKLSSFFTPKLTEEINKQQPPIFILPAGVAVKDNNQELDEDEPE